MYIQYSKTSDSGPSKIGTQYNKPLNKGHFSRSRIIGLPIVLIHFEPPRSGQPLYKGQKHFNLYRSQSVLCSEVWLYMYIPSVLIREVLLFISTVYVHVHVHVHVSIL